MSLIGKSVIGIDEFGNGGLRLENLPEEFRRVGEKFPLIVTGYLERRYTHATYGSEKFGSKKSRRFFGSKTDLSEVLRASRHYLTEHPNFLYMVIPHSRLILPDYLSIRAEAAVCLALRFIYEYKLDPNNTVLLTHEINGKKNSGIVHNLISAWFDSFLLPIKHFSKDGKAEERNPSLKAADMIGYYLGALKLFGDHQNWPHRQKKTELNQLLEYSHLISF